EAAARGDGHLLSPAVPFTTTVIVAVGVSSVTRLRRNRCPSRVTSYCCRTPTLPAPRSGARKSGTAVPTSSAVSPPTGTAVSCPSRLEKKSSFPSLRQRGQFPPSLEIWYLPPGVGKLRT